MNVLTHDNIVINNNKAKRGYLNVKQDCVVYMMVVAKYGSNCYGSENVETQGGWWQGDFDIWFRAEIWKGHIKGPAPKTAFA